MRRYLLGDDNLAFADNLAESLRDNRDEAVVAGNGGTALALVGEQRFDAVPTDAAALAREIADRAHEAPFPGPFDTEALLAAVEELHGRTP